MSAVASGAAALPRPYYQDDAVTIYHGDCREIAATLSADVLVSDPPYGIAERTDRAAKGRSNLAAANDFPAVFGDDSPFDPSPWLRFPSIVMFGANYFAHLLPPSASWIVWDKRDGITSNDNADCEMAWTNLGGPARIYRHMWSGMIKASERNDRRVHPTQKPVALMRWTLSHCPDGSVLDPFMGSGTTLRAAKDLGRKAIGIEIEERYCEIAANRCAQEVLDLTTGDRSAVAPKSSSPGAAA